MIRTKIVTWITDGRGAKSGSKLSKVCLNALDKEEARVSIECYPEAIVGVAEKGGVVFVVYNQAKLIPML